MIIKLYDKESDKTTIIYNPVVAAYDYGIRGGKFTHLSVIIVTAENTYDELYLILDKIDKESGQPYIHTYGVITDDKGNIIDFNNILATRNYIEQEINVEANHDFHEEHIIVEKYNLIRSNNILLADILYGIRHCLVKVVRGKLKLRGHIFEPKQLIKEETKDNKIKYLLKDNELVINMYNCKLVAIESGVRRKEIIPGK